MPRIPALRAAVLFASGIACAEALGLTARAAGFLLPFWVAGEFCLLLNRRNTSRLALLAATFTVVLSGLLALVLLNERDETVPPEGLRGVTLTGELVESPVTVGSRLRFTVQVATTDRGMMVAPGTLVAVTITRQRADGLAPDLECGSRVAIRGDLALPPGRRNPGTFDLRKYYAANGIKLLMVARGYRSVRVLPGMERTPLQVLVAPTRQHILRMIDRTIGGDEGEYLKGLLVGVRTGISRSDREAFVNAGVAHILAVSGSNVAALASTLFLLFKLFRFPRPALFLLSASGLLFYMVLTGGQPPVVRATIMALVLLLGAWLEEKSNPLNALGAAAILIFIVEPRQLFDVGFQLSFSAVFALLVLYPRADSLLLRITPPGFLHGPVLWLLRILALSLVATLGTLPVSATSFGRVSLVGLLANILVVPAASASVVLGILAVTCAPLIAPLAEAASQVNWLILHWSLLLTRIAGSLPFASVETYRWSGVLGLPFCAFLVMVFFFERGARARRLALLFIGACAVASLLPTEEWREKTPGSLRMSFMDVGQGDAILAQLPDGRNLLVDAGPASPAYDSGREVIAPFLKRLGIHSLDAIVLTHRHLDHAGGLKYLLDNFSGWELFLADSAKPSPHVHGADSLTRLLSAPGVRVYVLFPPGPSYRRVGSGANDQSVVIRIVFRRISFLLMGDAGAEVEALLVRSYGDFLRSDVLKVAHHGSANGSSECFLQSVRPRYAIVSVGMFNTFGHPSPVVMDRLTRASGIVSRTDIDGGILFSSDGDALRRIEWR